MIDRPAGRVKPALTRLTMRPSSTAKVRGGIGRLTLLQGETSRCAGDPEAQVTGIPKAPTRGETTLDKRTSHVSGTIVPIDAGWLTSG